MGATGYADDLILLSPSRDSMARMLKICQDYGVQHNLVFSTDPNPKKSKTKCIYFCGKNTVDQYPAKLTLDGKPLPFVPPATHLGHELQQSGTMDQDAKVKRARFIADSTDIRETFSFAETDQVLSAIKVYCGHFYGSMLWDFTSDSVGQFCRSWNTCVKLALSLIHI